MEEKKEKRKWRWWDYLGAAGWLLIGYCMVFGMINAAALSKYRIYTEGLEKELKECQDHYWAMEGKFSVCKKDLDATRGELNDCLAGGAGGPVIKGGDIVPVHADVIRDAIEFINGILALIDRDGNACGSDNQLSVAALLMQKRAAALGIKLSMEFCLKVVKGGENE